jgi:hypothetical protein
LEVFGEKGRGFFREKGRVGGKRDRDSRTEGGGFWEEAFFRARGFVKDRFGKRGAEKPRGGANFNLSLPPHPSILSISFFSPENFSSPKK